MLKFSEHLLHKTPIRRTVSALGQDFVVESTRTGWKTSVIDEGQLVELARYSSRKEAFNNLGRDAVEYVSQFSFQMINESAPGWVDNLTDKIISNRNILKLGAVSEIVKHEYGTTLVLADSTYSEKLDDLGMDQSMWTNNTLEIVLSDVSSEEEGLIDAGLLEIPSKYSLEIILDSSSENGSISSFSAQKSEAWYYTVEDLQDLYGYEQLDKYVNNLLDEVIVPWYNDFIGEALTKLEVQAAQRG